MSKVAKVVIYLSIAVFYWILNNLASSEFLRTMSAICIFIFPIIFGGLRRSLQDTIAIWRKNAGLPPKKYGVIVNFFNKLFRSIEPSTIRKISEASKNIAFVGFLFLFLLFAFLRVPRNIVLMIFIIPIIFEFMGSCISDVVENKEWKMRQVQKRS